MQVKVTVSQQGGKTGNSFSQSITMKDAGTLEEVKATIEKEFGKLFPRYQSLDAIPQKKEKGKKDV